MGERILRTRRSRFHPLVGTSEREKKKKEYEKTAYHAGNIPSLEPIVKLPEDPSEHLRD